MTGMPEKPTQDEVRRFLADCNARRTGWSLFQKGARRAAERMVSGLSHDITNPDQENP